MSRIKNSLQNVKFSVIGQVVNVLLSFISRKIFITVLSVEYMGLSGLFSNILSLLSITELGIGSALICFLYKPLAEDDHNRIIDIMYLYRKIYIGIGCIVLVLGSSMTPFLGYFINELPNIPNISLIYILYVLNSASSYFLCYKRELIIANQQRYIFAIYDMYVKCAMYIAQIAVLLITKNYIVFLLIMIASTLIENILISIVVNKLYPYLKKSKGRKLQKSDAIEIKTKIVASSFHKIGDVLVTSTDNILISKIVGIIGTGLYSNYLIIISTLNTVMTLVYNSILASVGNLGVESNNEYKEKVFDRINFMTAWAFGFSSVCLMSLFNPFIQLWLGEKYLLDQATVITIIINFYLIGMRRPIAMMRDAFGIFTHDKYKVIPEVIINFVVSIFAGIKFGISGIILGTIVSNLCTTFWTYPYILYKYGFGQKVGKYYKKYIFYFVINLTVTVVCYLFCEAIPVNSLISFIVKLAICVTVPNLLFAAIYCRSEHFKFFISLVKNKLLLKR